MAPAFKSQNDLNVGQLHVAYVDFFLEEGHPVVYRHPPPLPQ